MDIRLETDFCISWEDGDDRDLGAMLDQVASHLVLALGARGLAIASEGDDTFTISLVVESKVGEEPEETYWRGMGDIRTAFHAHGLGTLGWPSPGLKRSSFEPLSERTYCSV